MTSYDDLGAGDRVRVHAGKRPFIATVVSASAAWVRVKDARGRRFKLVDGLPVTLVARFRSSVVAATRRPAATKKPRDAFARMTAAAKAMRRDGTYSVLTRRGKGFYGNIWAKLGGRTELVLTTNGEHSWETMDAYVKRMEREFPGAQIVFSAL